MKERKKEKILESLAGARQLVAWNTATNCYEASWITKKELVEHHGQRQADKMWRDECFKGTCKIFPEFAHPVTEGQALVSWMKMGWSWEDARAYWQQAPQAHMAPIVADESSRERIRRRLQELSV